MNACTKRASATKPSSDLHGWPRVNPLYQRFADTAACMPDALALRAAGETLYEAGEKDD